MKDKVTDYKEYLQDKLSRFVEDYQKYREPGSIFRAALLGAADVHSPVIKGLRETTFEEHSMPEDFMESPAVVISYFLAYTPEVGDSNISVEGNATSRLWSNAYDYADRITAAIREFLISEIEQLGFRAVSPVGLGMREDVLKSSWSHRHMAYAAGLGTFGINNMLITPYGCCGRYDSIISDIPLVTDGPLTEEYCLYKKDGSCAVCVRNCFSGALTTEGFDRFKCYETCKTNIPLYGQDVCGKCTTGIPCAYMAPGKSL